MIDMKFAGGLKNKEIVGLVCDFFAIVTFSPVSYTEH